MVQDIHPPMSVYSESPQLDDVKNPLSKEESSNTTNETSPFLPQHKLPNSIQYVPIALAPTILPLTYNPNKKNSRKRHHILCQCRGIFVLITLFFLLTILVHYIVWLCLKKDKDMSLMEFILK